MRSTHGVTQIVSRHIRFAALPCLLLALLAAGPSARCQAQQPGAAESQLHEALYQEIYAQNDQRQQQLEAALAADPDLAAARWHLGQMNLEGQWLSVDEAIATRQNEELLAEYAEYRAACVENPTLHRELAIWCRRHNLVDRERYHWQQVLAQFPQDREALRALSLFYGPDGKLTSLEDRQESRELRRQWEQAEDHWRPILARHRRAILRGTPQEKQAALAALAEIEDEWCLPTLEDLFSREGGELGLAAVAAIANIQHPWATQSLLRHAIVSEDEAVRTATLLALADRPLHDTVPPMLAELRAPVSVEFYDIESQPGVFVLRCELLFETPEVTYSSNVDLPLEDPSSRAALREDRVDRAAACDAISHSINERYVAVLTAVSGQSKDLTPREWSNWWNDYNLLERQPPRQAAFDMGDPYLCGLLMNFWSGGGFASSPEWLVVYNPQLGRHLPFHGGQFYYGELPTRYIVGRYTILPGTTLEYGTLVDAHFTNSLVGISPGAYVYDSQAGGWPMFSYNALGLVPNISCFAAGTPVLTDQGLVAIEDILPGDCVLSQDVETGELSFKIVTGCTIREPTEVSSVTVAGEAIVASGGHPVWVNGAGWRMVCELESGDSLHGLSGAHLLSDVVAQEEPQAVYNLVVEDNHNYFVGDSHLLVHDVTMREPTQAIVPGLVESP